MTARNRISEHRGFSNVLTPLALVLGKFDDQNAVLGGQRDQHHEPDLGIEVERQAPKQNPDKRAQDPDRNR